VADHIAFATLTQLVASFAAPAVVLTTGHDDWVLPSIAITIGPLPQWLGTRLAIARYRLVGWTLIIEALLLVTVMNGTALVVTTGLTAGTLLLGTAAIGFRQLGALSPAVP
jgi:hypothetical protein